jgi:hypothetical protein
MSFHVSLFFGGDLLELGSKRELERWGGQVGCITRLVPQKGVHLIRHSIYPTLERGGQFIFLGSSPIPHIPVQLMLHRAHKYILSKFLTRDGLNFSIQTMVVTIFTLVVYSMSLKEFHANLIITIKFDWCWSMMRPFSTLCCIRHLCDPLYIWALWSHTGQVLQFYFDFSRCWASKVINLIKKQPLSACIILGLTLQGVGLL